MVSSKILGIGVCRIKLDARGFAEGQIIVEDFFGSFP